MVAWRRRVLVDRFPFAEQWHLRGHKKAAFPFAIILQRRMGAQVGEAVVSRGYLNIIENRANSMQRFKKKPNKQAPQNDEGNNIDKALCMGLHYK